MKIILLFQSRCPTPDGFIDDIKAISWSPVRSNDINWNFEKVLIDHEGQPVTRYTAPYGPKEIRGDILKLIQACQGKKKQKTTS